LLTASTRGGDDNGAGKIAESNKELIAALANAVGNLTGGIPVRLGRRGG